MSVNFTPRQIWLLMIAVLLVGCARAMVGPVRGEAAEVKPFGIVKFTLQTTERTEERLVENSPGAFGSEFVNKPYTFTQAGGHPWALTATGVFTTENIPASSGVDGVIPVPTQDPKDVVTGLPAGLLGDPQAVPQCPLALATSSEECPPDTQIGSARLVYEGGHNFIDPIVNVAPEAGQSAEFVLEGLGKGIFTPLLTAHLVRSAQGEYAFTVVSGRLPLVALTEFELTFWGVPADRSHDTMRGKFCIQSEAIGPIKCEGGGQTSGVVPVPFLTMPMNCSAGPETATLRADSWEEPGSVREGHYTGYAESTATLPGATGCGLLQFNQGTGIAVEPDTSLADEPVGLGVSLHVPQSEAPERNAAPLLRDTRVTLPEGMSVSPGIVDGIRACEASGPEGIDITGPESEELGLNGELQLAPGHCPDASIVGTAEAVTPLLPFPVKGHVYLARPGCGGAGQAPCTEADALDGNLYKLYLEIGGKGVSAGEGIVFKVPFEVQANPATGQLTTNVQELVQAPYSEVHIELNGGPRAPLANPATCGPATTSADFTPWSGPGTTPQGLTMAGTPDLVSSSFFDVTGCASPPPFTPGFVAGTVSPQAGRFSSFTLNLARGDREQYVKGIQVHTPPGLLGILASVPLCGEPQADEGHCPESSKIGTARVASGAGSHPFEIGGSVYLTGPYGGAPFGLSVVTNAVAGPFNLGLVVVRARIAVDPETSQLTITTDESGPHAVPQIIFGVPLRLQRIAVDIDRPGFMFNPTNCAPQQITARIAGSQDAVASVASPFAAGGCRSLAFKPKFTVSTSGHTSRANGASLDVRLSYPPGSLGSEANVARVKVDLPKQLPSRLTTLQKACPAATFERNPARCPQASIVGTVRATTPLLAVALSGPVYFVSHGGEAFPSLIVVLQGDNVRVDLTGSTFISKTGITSSTFKTVPDVPVSTFELYLPEGTDSALAANGNLCKSAGKLTMPTEFLAQNGAVLKQSTKIQVTGCVRHKTKRAGHTARRAGKRGHGRSGK
jgi:hypothetical protein